MKKTILYFLVVPFVMLILSLTCTKEEGADCHKRISTNNASETPIYVIDDVNNGLGPTYPSEFALKHLADPTTRKHYMLAPGEATNRIVYDEQICYEHRCGTFVSRDYLIIFFLDAKKVDSLNTLEKLIEHNKEICLGSRRFRTFKEMEQANFRVTYPDDAELYTSNKKFNKITAIQKQSLG